MGRWTANSDALAPHQPDRSTHENHPWQATFSADRSKLSKQSILTVCRRVYSTLPGSSGRFFTLSATIFVSCITDWLSDAYSTISR
jgi:hypothetical protein